MRHPIAQLALAAVLGTALEAQTRSDPNPRLGMQPGGVYSLGDIEALNHVNGNMTIRIPIGSLGPDRAGASHGVSLVYNSKIWEGTVESMTVNGNSLPVHAIKRSSTGGWQYQMGYQLEETVRPEADPNSCPAPGSGQAIPNHLLYTRKLHVVFPDGSKHLLRPHVDMTHGSTVDNYGDGYYQFGPDGLYGGYCNTNPTYGTLPNPLIYYTTDGTFVRLAVTRDSASPPNTTWVLSFKNGDYVTGGGSDPQRICDRNDNCVSLDFVITSAMTFTDAYFTRMSDDFGREITISYNGCPNTSGSCTPASYLGGTNIITAPGYNGATLTWTVNWQWVLSTGAQYVAPVLEGSESATPPQPGPEYMVSEIHLPAEANLQPYRFAYTGRWGELTSVTLPTGTIARYTYWLDSPAGGNCASTASARVIPNWYDVLANYPCYKQVSYAGGTQTDEQSYFVITQGTYYNTTAYTSSVYTGPDGGVTRTVFDNCSGSNPNCYSYNVGSLAGNWLSGLPNKIEQPDGMVVTQTWARNPLYGTMVGSPLGCSGAPSLCTELFPYDSQNVYIQQQTRTLGGSDATTTYTVDRNGNPLVTAETNWGGATLRTTTSTYFNATSSASTAPTSNEPYVYWNGGAGRLLDLVSTKRIDGPTSPSSYEQFCYDNSASPVTGNVTLHARLASGSAGGTLVTCPGTSTASSSSVVVTKFAYGANGIMTASMDGRGVATQLLYNPNGLYVTEKREGCNQSLTSQACTLPERRITSYTMDLNTGLPRTVSDSDNGTATTTEYDSLGRPTKVKDPSGAETTYQYFDSASPRYVLITSPLDSARSIRSVQCFDQLGRLTGTVTSENGGTPSCSGAANVIQTQRQYINRYSSGASGCGIGAAGRYECASNPYRSIADTTMGWIQNKYDGAGRLVETGHVDASRQTVRSKITYSYNGACTTIKDEAANATNADNPGSTRTVCKDAAGRILSVTEIGQKTTYNYDGMDNLTDVHQGAQHRQFRYDSLGRLTSSVNPESNWNAVQQQWVPTTYSYDYNGNLTSKTDARSVTTTLAYDSLNRLTSRQYSDGTHSVTNTWCLDQTCTVPYGVGRLIQTVSNGTTVQYTQFDPNGRVLQHSQSNPQMNSGNAAAFSYAYNQAGSLTRITYPSGRSVATEYDKAGRAAVVSGSMGGTTKNYARGPNDPGNASCTQCIGYAPHGGIRQMYLSQDVINEQHGYNGRLQPTSIATTLVSSGQTIRSLGWSYAASQQSDGADNNGNILSQTIAGSGLTGAVTQTYAYDGANRIGRASEGSCSPLQGFSYDTWGNGWVSSYTQSSVCPSPGSNTPVANVYETASNRSGVNYSTWDAAGRQQSVGGYGFTYDAENRMISSTLNSTTVYQYDGDGRRVAKINCPGTGTCTPATSGASTVWYVYDAGGNLATEFGQSAMASALPCTTCYLMADHLGSTRVMMDQNGTAVSGGCHDYLPFGEEIYSPIGNRSTSCYPTGFKSGMLFTGQLRDAQGESGLDYFSARYYSGAQGRFTSPDPLLESGRPENPQSWNRYSYGLNNPLRYIDPTGLEAISAEECKKNPDCVSVPINVIYDQNAQLYDRQGNILPEVQQKVDDQIAAAQDTYGDALVSFDISYSTGAIQSSGKNSSVTGMQPGINVVVTDSRDSLVPGRSREVKGGALILLNAGTSDRSTLPHELGHVLAGDTRVPRIKVIGQLMNTAFDVRTDAARMMLPFYSPYHGNRIDPLPGQRPRVTNLFNQGAQRFRR